MNLVQRVEHQIRQVGEIPLSAACRLSDFARYSAREGRYAVMNAIGIAHEQLRADFPIEWRNKPLGVENYSANPIVLLHGYGENRGIFLDYEDRLRVNGFGLIYRINYDFFDRMDETSEGKVLERVREIKTQSRCGSGKVDIVGFSEGGIVARYFAKHHTDLVDHCVMIGAPNGGTYLALAGYIAMIGDISRTVTAKKKESHVGVSRTKYHVSAESVRQMMKGSRFLKRLNRPREGDPVKYVNIYSRADEILLSTTDIEGAINVDIRELGIPGIGHLGLIHDPLVIDWSVQFLRKALNGEWKDLVGLSEEDLVTQFPLEKLPSYSTHNAKSQHTSPYRGAARPRASPRK